MEILRVWLVTNGTRSTPAEPAHLYFLCVYVCFAQSEQWLFISWGDQTYWIVELHLRCFEAASVEEQERAEAQAWEDLTDKDLNFVFK